MKGCYVILWFLVEIGTVMSLSLPMQQSDGSHNLLEITNNLEGCNCFRATYTRGNVTLYIRSDLRDGEIVSAIDLVQGDQISIKLTELSVPEDYLYKRYVTGIEKRIISSAEDLLQTLKTSTDMRLDKLISVFDGMVDELHSQTSQLPFNHVRSSLFYHSSIIHATKRLMQSIPADQICPPYEAYEYRGLFICKQEYEEYYHLAIGSSLFECTTEQCMVESLSDLGRSSSPSVSVQGKVRRTKRSFFNLNETLKAFARLKACGTPHCKVRGCEDDNEYGLGWNILGSDWGCCGDYEGCCYLAENTCLLHDAICTCCTFKYFCVDVFCIPDPWCDGN